MLKAMLGIGLIAFVPVLQQGNGCGQNPYTNRQEPLADCPGPAPLGCEWVVDGECYDACSDTWESARAAAEGDWDSACSDLQGDLEDCWTAYRNCIDVCLALGYSGEACREVHCAEYFQNAEQCVTNEIQEFTSQVGAIGATMAQADADFIACYAGCCHLDCEEASPVALRVSIWAPSRVAAVLAGSSVQMARASTVPRSHLGYGRLGT